MFAHNGLWYFQSVRAVWSVNKNYLLRRILRRILPAADITLLLEQPPLGIFNFKSGGLLDTLLSLGECLLFNSVSSSEDSVMLKSLKFSGSGLLRTWPLLTGWYWLMTTLTSRPDRISATTQLFSIRYQNLITIIEVSSKVASNSHFEIHLTISFVFRLSHA